MAKTSPKWYVVWVGHSPGVYTSWDKAQKQINGFPGAKYKSYTSEAAAHEAFSRDHASEIATGSSAKSAPKKKTAWGCVLPAIAVDAACNMSTGEMEYRGVDIESGTLLFSMGPFYDSSNNLGEFLALVHALAYCKERGITMPIYSDSRTALAWVRNKLAKTTVERTHGNANVFALIQRAENWLRANTYPNKCLKWDTENWGEIPADYGRK